MKVMSAIIVVIFIACVTLATAGLRRQEGGLLPQCTVNRSEADVRAEIVMQKKISVNPGLPKYLCQKFVKADPASAVPNVWRIEFAIEVPTNEDSEQKMDELTQTYGLRNVHKINHEFARGGWVECDEATAKQISQLPFVRRVLQDYR